MIPISTTQDLIERWENFIELDKVSKNFTAYSIMLYSDEDEILVKYIRDNWNKLHNDLGESMHLFVFEKPAFSDDDLTKAQSYWNKIGLKNPNPQEAKRQTMPYSSDQCF